MSKQCTCGGGRFVMYNYNKELEGPRDRTSELWSGVPGLNLGCLQELRGFAEVHPGKSWDVISIRLLRCLSNPFELIVFSAM
jgi:hypothetical protein